MSRDRTVGETFYLRFTTRAFATGIPTTLSGTPVVSAYEDGSVTQITAGITLGVDHDSVTGLNLLTIVATGGNGFETGKDYDLVITTGTVGGVSVVGEVVGQFSLGLSAAFTRIGANGAGLTDLATAADLATVDGNVDAILVDTGEIGAAGAGLTVLATAAALATAQTDLDTITGADGVNLLSATQASVDAIEADTNELQTDDVPGLIAALNDPTAAAVADAVLDETLSGHVGAGTLGKAVADIETDATAILADTADIQPKIGSPAADLAADVAAVKVDTAATLVDTAQIGVAGAGLTDLGGMSTGMKAEVNAEADTALTDYDGPTNAEMEARTPTAAQLAYIVRHALTAQLVTFSAGGSTTTAVFDQVDGSAASSTNDWYNGRILLFITGTLAGQATDITDYVGATKTATITAVTAAPDSSTAIIL